MLKNKQINIFSENYKERMHNYFNPYVFNFEGSKNCNNDLVKLKTESHIERKKNNK